MYRILIIPFCLLLLFQPQSTAQWTWKPGSPVSPRGDLRIMWYNVENLFHPSDDPSEGDDDFTPAGPRHWTVGRYRDKLTGIAKVIVAAGRWEPPEVVGLGEIENDSVLEDLVHHPILESYGYSYLHRESGDHRGMDVACLVRRSRIEVLQMECYHPPLTGWDSATRDILHVCVVPGRRTGIMDTLDIYWVHFISKYRGEGATAGSRRSQAAYLLHLADSVAAVRGSQVTILAGDFNDTFDSFSLEPLRKGIVRRDSILPVELTGPEGSYRYRGLWSRIDMFLLAGRPVHLNIQGRTLYHPELLVRDEKYGGWKPFRTYEGYAYRGGVSDHLPILLDISGY